MFVGRLDDEKGAGLLLDAWERVGGRLPAGAPAAWYWSETGRSVPALPRQQHLALAWSGGADSQRTSVQRALQQAALAVVPSRCYEGAPVVLTEALAAGRPLLVTSGGVLPELGADAAAVSTPEAAALADALVTALGDDTGLAHRAAAARSRYLLRHTEEALGALLERTYDEVRR